MINSKCKICRRAGVKLFLKGERCISAKCEMVKKPYPPGQKGKRKKSPLSEFGIQLKEKQKLKNLYNLNERQFKNYVEKTLEKRGKVEDTSALLLQYLESRLDNVVFRLGFASSRAQARQLVSHSYFLVNGRTTNIPSYQLKKDDIVAIKPQKLKKTIFKDLKNLLKKYKTPNWLSLNVEKLEGKMIGIPTLEERGMAVEIPSIFEYYSR